MLYPAHTVEPLAGDAALSVGAVGAALTGQVTMVVGPVELHPLLPPERLTLTITLPVAPVVVIALPLVYGFHTPPLLIVYSYRSAAPVEPPEPDVIVTVPKLYPAQIAVVVAGVAVFKVGLTVAEPRVQVQMVPQAVAEHP